MRSASGALIALLNTSQSLFIADLYTIATVNNGTFYYTSADADVTVGAIVFASNAVGIERSKFSASIGLKVDTMDVTFFSKPGLLIAGVTWPQFAMTGGLDGADITLQRVYMPTWGDVSAGALLLFNGRVSTVTPERTQVQVTVESDLSLLSMQMPRNLYQPGCDHTLYDAGCGITRGSVTVAATVLSVVDASNVYVTGPTVADDYYALGTFTLTSGAAAGVSRTIKAQRTDTNGMKLTFIRPLTTLPSPADTGTVIPGCDKKLATCFNKFNNLGRFRGFPYIPVPETAV